MISSKAVQRLFPIPLVLHKADPHSLSMFKGTGRLFHETMLEKAVDDHCQQKHLGTRHSDSICITDSYVGKKSSVKAEMYV